MNYHASHWQSLLHRPYIIFRSHYSGWEPLSTHLSKNILCNLKMCDQPSNKKWYGCSLLNRQTPYNRQTGSSFIWLLEICVSFSFNFICFSKFFFYRTFLGVILFILSFYKIPNDFFLISDISPICYLFFSLFVSLSFAVLKF